MFYKKKRKNRIKHIIASDKDDYKAIAGKFVPGRYGVVYMENDRGEITGIKSETEIMERVTGS